MTYARIENGAIAEYPLYAGDIQARFPNSSFPAPFAPPAGYEPVADVTQPTIDHTQNIAEGQPELIGGQWTRTWVVTPASQEEIDARLAGKAQSIRANRDARLRSSDWTQFGDAAVDTAAWAAYRQALRDVPDQPGFPFDVTWPEPPAAEGGSVPRWRPFLAALQASETFTALRGLSRSSISANALATELRLALGEAALGKPDVPSLQALVAELIPLLDTTQLNEIAGLLQTYSIPITLS